MRRLVFLLPFLVLASGCDGAFVSEDSVSVEIVSDGLAVTNERSVPIYVAALGEWALIYVDPLPQTAENPGAPIAPGQRVVLGFSADGLIRRADNRYTVNWITVENDEIGASGYLDLRR